MEANTCAALIHHFYVINHCFTLFLPRANMASADQGGPTAADDSLLPFLHDLPKIELHAHLSGSVREKTVLRLLQEEASIVSRRQGEFASDAGRAESAAALAEELLRINTEIRDFKLGEFR